MTLSPRRGLTCLEVLVAVAAIALLVSAMFPVLKRNADQTRDQRENHTTKLLTRALTSYAADNADKVVPAHPNWNWVHPGAGSNPYLLQPHDPFNANRRLSGTVAKTYMSHLADGRGITPADMQVDTATAAIFNTRTTNPSTFLPPNFYDFDSTSAQAAYLWHPSFGYNGVFVGGSYRHGAHTDGQYGLTNNQYGGAFYVQRMSQVTAPSRLIAFAASRGADVGVNAGTWWNFGAAYPDGTSIRPGYWLVTPPRGTMPNVTAWSASNTYNANLQPSTWGNIDCRAGNSKALVAQIDGSSQTLSLQSLRDMRRWAVQANDPNWSWTPGQNVP